MRLINLARKPAKPETYGERLAQAVGLSRMLSEFSEKKGFEPSVLYLASLITIASFNAVFMEEGRSDLREWGLKRLEEYEEALRKEAKEEG
jgi:hypothetical protein